MHLLGSYQWSSGSWQRFLLQFLWFREKRFLESFLCPILAGWQGVVQSLLLHGPHRLRSRFSLLIQRVFLALKVLSFCPERRRIWEQSHWQYRFKVLWSGDLRYVRMKLSLHSQDREIFLWSVILQETQRLRGFLPFWRRKIKVFVSWYREINGKFKEKLKAWDLLGWELLGFYVCFAWFSFRITV